jgi:DNA-binding beta-propeller fold protein YncE
MATIEQAPPTSRGETTETGASPLDALLARAYTLNWEAIFYVTIFAIAILTRFIGLGDRVMSHDESLHVVYSWNLWQKGDFQHTPLMHGPVLFHATALSFFLFGDNDFTGRLYPAILGVIMVLMPKLLFERWLGRMGAAVTTVLILISPMLLYHHRYIREDTPSIFYTLLMVYATFAYLDGAKPRQLRHLILLSASMLLSLATKEVAFMYIAIFGFVLTIYWLFQVVQGLRTGLTRPIVGYVIGGVIGVGLLGLVAVLAGNFLGDRLAAAGGATISGRLLAIPIALVLAVFAYVIYRPLRKGVGTLALHGNSLFMLVLAGMTIGTIAALALTCILTIIQPKDIWKTAAATTIQEGQAVPPVEVVVDQVLLNRLIIWVTIMVMALALVVIVTALIRFARSPRMPWADIIIIALVAVLFCSILVFFEERSRSLPNLSVDRAREEASAVLNAERHNEWLAASWIVGAALVAGLVWLRYGTSFFEELKRYPVFDVLIVMGTLVLPWLSAIPIWAAGYPLDQVPPGQDTINAGIIGTVPFLILSVVAGLMWNPTWWLACAATFYSIFAFFFTTIFTNINGLFTGLVGSLGYWLVQQGVRRGSQPQYYYIFTQLPVYEFLPLIGAMIAGYIGMLRLWRFRGERMDAALEAASVEWTEDEAQPDSSQDSVQESADDAMNVTQVSSTTQILEANAVNAANTAQSEAATMPDETQMELQTDLQTEELAAIGMDSTDEPEKPKNKQKQEWTEEELRLYEEEQRRIEAERRRIIDEAEWIDRMPFLPFTGLWGVLIILAFTMAGEKMPWLTTHLTIPLILLTGWYVGTLLEKFDWQAFWQRGWGLIILLPVLVIAGVNVVGPFLLGTTPFSGLEMVELQRTFTWMGAVLLGGFVGYVVYRIWKQIGTTQTVRIGLVGVFVLLGVLTWRAAWIATYINYDYATEYLVYAHGAPANKTVMGVIEDLSRRTTDGLNIRVAYDNEVSWPGSWYFRRYPPGSFKGDMSGVTDLDSYAAIVVGDGNNSKIESQVADKFYKIKYARLWWPMQDYFDLNLKRIDNIFASDDNLPEGWVSGSKLRQGLWQIWWNRDYKMYGEATNQNMDVSKWPVTDWMYFYVRKDFAAQIWNFGTDAVKVATLPEDPFKTLRCDTCAANAIYAGAGNEAGKLRFPHGVAVGPDGSIYVADSQNSRIAIFDPDGKALRQFGVPGSVDPEPGTPPAPAGAFREPWGVAVALDGTIYVADTWNHRVQAFNNNGTPKNMWGQFEQIGGGQSSNPNGFWGPRDIAVDPKGNVYVADTGNKRIRVYDPTGKFLYNIGQGGAAPGQLNEPVGLAINTQTNEIFVADTWNKRINVYDLTGTYRRSWNIQAWGATTETGSRPYLALDPSGVRVFVTDPDAGRVLVYDQNGVPLLTFGALGNANTYSATNFGTLGGIVIDKQGRLFLADSASGRLLRFEITSLPGLIQPVTDGSATNPLDGLLDTPEATPDESEIF